MESGKVSQMNTGQGLGSKQEFTKQTGLRENSGKWNSTCRDLDKYLKPLVLEIGSKEPSSCTAQCEVN